MHTQSEPVTGGFRALFELVQAAGGQLVDGLMQLPAQTTLFIVAVSIQKTLLRQWLSPVEDLLPPVLTTHHPLVIEALLTPEIQRILTDLALPRSRPYLPAFFYKIRLQELIYWHFGLRLEDIETIRQLTARHSFHVNKGWNGSKSAS